MSADYKRTKLLPPYTAEGKTTFQARNADYITDFEEPPF